jgi:uncharacterized OsmC-like protein
MRLNNIDIGKVGKTVEEIRKNPSKALRRVEVEGEWVIEPSEFQFSTVCTTESGRFTLEVDSPSFMGGGGTRPTPMHYCLTGIASCFMATFVGVATERGIKVREARIRASCTLDLKKPLGVGEGRIINNVAMSLEVEADALREVLDDVLREAIDRCPAIYSLRNPVETEITLLTRP